jgi:rare lipoprotein A
VAARPLGIVSMGAATVIAQVVPATTPLGPARAPRNLLALQAADPNPAAAFTTYELKNLPDSAALAATEATAAPTTPPTATPTAAPTFLVQVGIFQETQNAEAMQARVRSLDPTLTVEIKQEALMGQQVSRVFISQLDTWLAAETVQRRLQSWGVTGVVRQLPSEAVVASTSAPVAAPVN